MEVERLLNSLVAQRYDSMEVILVDDNEDDRLKPIVAPFHQKLQINHIRMGPRGVSAARNAGFKAARGRIVTFPDDDCWYPPTLVKDVVAWFVNHADYAVLAVACLDETGVKSGNRWFQDDCDLKVSNALRTTMMPTVFLDCTSAMRDVFFDEELSYGEDTDFVLRQLKVGVKGRLDSSLNIFHPCRDMLSGTVTTERAVNYGSGMGFLVRRHATLVMWVALLAYDLSRAALVACRGRLHDASNRLRPRKGFVEGLPEGSSARAVWPRWISAEYCSTQTSRGIPDGICSSLASISPGRILSAPLHATPSPEQFVHRSASPVTIAMVDGTPIVTIFSDERLQRRKR